MIFANIATRARAIRQAIDTAGRRPTTAREFLLFALLTFSLLWATQRKEVTYIVTDPGNHHVLTKL